MVAYDITGCFRGAENNFPDMAVTLTKDIWHNIAAIIQRASEYREYRALACVSQGLNRIWREESPILTLETTRDYQRSSVIHRDHSVKIYVMPQNMGHVLHGSVITNSNYSSTICATWLVISP